MSPVAQPCWSHSLSFASWAGPGNGTFFSFVRHRGRQESGSIQGINIYVPLTVHQRFLILMGNNGVYKREKEE